MHLFTAVWVIWTSQNDHIINDYRWTLERMEANVWETLLEFSHIELLTCRNTHVVKDILCTHEGVNVSSL